MTHTFIDDLSPYFKQDGDRWIFTGKKLEVYIPKVYEDKGLLRLGEVVTTLGIIHLRINDMFYSNLMILARLTIEYINIDTVTEDDYDYVVLTLVENSVFIKNRYIVKDSDLIYTTLMVFLALGKIPPFISYDNIHRLYDNDKKHCGVDLSLNHSIMEMICAHIYRSKDDPYQFYRHTRMNEKPIIVPIHQISHAPQSTTARIVGSYLTEGITSSLVDDTERTPSIVENLLRS